MQILGVALLLLALEAWNVGTGSLDGATVLAVQLVIAGVPLFVISRSFRSGRPGFVALGGLIGVAVGAAYVSVVLGGHTEDNDPHRIHLLTGLMTGIAASCLLPLSFRRRY
ncbi:hypothetical protein [Nocardioides cavernaquae]|uniref:Uncharacterized protein n=1 Tax=Nocardioides cavernaquae TaxID=2321396 RepID=A0A3A5H562_9ACTN|nr:hypothetical protein [Nocardioides cavernaquae]RJS45846.1 hypothetical protein D4739_06145 [Nocardioides cavernaquae]